VSFITAVLVYVGAAGSNSTYSVFGLHPSVLDLTVQDHLLNSSGLTIRLLARVLLLVVGLVLVHLLATRLLTGRIRAARAVSAGTAAAGLLLFAAGVLGLLGRVTYDVSEPLIPAYLGLGLLLFGYAGHLYTATTGRPLWPGTASPTIRNLGRAAFAGFLFLAMLWSTAVYALQQGVPQANALLADPRRLPRVVVYSAERLQLEGPGITETRLPQRPGEPAEHRYRYDGLRLLLHTNERYFLLPLCWRQDDRSRAIALPDDPSLRLEFRHSTELLLECPAA
jgi:hypothetical protein